MMTSSAKIGANTAGHGQSTYPVSFSPMKSTCNAPMNVIPWLLEPFSVLITLQRYEKPRRNGTGNRFSGSGDGICTRVARLMRPLSDCYSTPQYGGPCWGRTNDFLLTRQVL